MLAEYNVANLWINMILTGFAGLMALWAGRYTLAPLKVICAMVALLSAIKVFGYVYLIYRPETETGWSDAMRGVAVVERIVVWIIPMYFIGRIARRREDAIRMAQKRQDDLLGHEEDGY